MKSRDSLNYEASNLKFFSDLQIPTIGILGGGQLARMSAYAAFRLGLNVAIYEQKSGSPASHVTPYSFVGDWLDEAELLNFAARCARITLENEFVSPDTLRYLESLGKRVYPSSITLSLIQDKLIQKETLRQNGLPVARFAPISSAIEASNFGREHGYPFLLKSRTGGYDGYGNRTVKNSSDIDESMRSLGFPNRNLMAESFVKFERELATMVVRNPAEEVKVYPIVETVQENHICKIVQAPASVSEELKWAAADLASAAIASINGVGIFGVEMFLTKEGNILINELAPRPHNSGHYSIEACVTSQFENHIRAIMNFPLGDTAMITPAAAMVNLLGKRNHDADFKSLPDALQFPNAKIHIYGKSESRVGRKMGHITVLGETIEACLSDAQAAESKITL